jgi:hypothetical protein
LCAGRHDELSESDFLASAQMNCSPARIDTIRNAVELDFDSMFALEVVGAN